MSKYAKNTSVSTEKTIGEIQKLLAKYGATAFAYMTSDKRVTFAFEMSNRRIKFTLFLDMCTSDQHIRSHYRGLLLSIKSKLVSVDIGIETFEEAFLANIVLPGGCSFGENYIPQIEKIYKSGNIPALSLN